VASIQFAVDCQINARSEKQITQPASFSSWAFVIGNWKLGIGHWALEI
jgi:hypothetical protein